MTTRARQTIPAYGLGLSVVNVWQTEQGVVAGQRAGRRKAPADRAVGAFFAFTWLLLGQHVEQFPASRSGNGMRKPAGTVDAPRSPGSLDTFLEIVALTSGDSLVVLSVRRSAAVEARGIEQCKDVGVGHESLPNSAKMPLLLNTM
jgi:hypothetical protein